MPTTANFIYPKGALVIMTKSPVLGQVKTRMQPALSQEQSVQLHSALAQYAIEQWQKSQLCPLYCFIKGDQQKLLQKIPACSHHELFAQAKGDLGDKMLSAAHTIAEQYQPEFMVLLGTDCPFITKEYLQQAIDALAIHDVVIGPANDGGYVLLGFKTVHKVLFDNTISWGSDSVLTDTQAILNNCGLSFEVLSSLNDIDRPADLAQLNNIKALASLAQLLN